MGSGSLESLLAITNLPFEPDAFPEPGSYARKISERAVECKKLIDRSRELIASSQTIIANADKRLIVPTVVIRTPRREWR
jgi:hypothetical protein